MSAPGPAPPDRSAKAPARRLYRTCAVVEEGGGYALVLDRRPVRTPGRAPLVLPTRALADAVAAEWRAQGARPDPRTMPHTRLANTAIDRVRPRRDAVVREVAAYAETDLVCHRAAEPAELVARQNAAWQPLVEWAAARHGGALRVTVGLMPRPQPPQAVAALRRAVDAFDDMALAALHLATAACGSVVIALALADGRLDADAAFAASQVDETFQMEQWGEDAQAAARRRAVHADVRAAADFLALLAG